MTPMLDACFSFSGTLRLMVVVVDAVDIDPDPVGVLECVASGVVLT